MIGNSRERWGAVHKAFHWLVGLMVVVQIGTGVARAIAQGDDARDVLMTAHINIGVTILLLSLLRLTWRLSQPVPALPDTLSSGEKTLARGTHYALYGFLIAVPLLGFLTANSGGYSAVLWGVVELPQLLPEDDQAKDAFEILHILGVGAFAAVIAIHVAGALRHEYRLRDNVLRRMLPFARLRGE
jgi:cytochrome b561